MHMHMQVLSQVPIGLLSASQQVYSPGPNRSALQVPTGPLFGCQQVSSPGPKRSHRVPTGAIRRCRQASSPGPKRSHLQCLRPLVIARHHRQQLLCLLLCFSGLGVALHQCFFMLSFSSSNSLTCLSSLSNWASAFARPVRTVSSCLVAANPCLGLALGGVRHRLCHCRRDAISHGHTHVLRHEVLAPLSVNVPPRQP